jgi:hypothetical protein
MDDQKTPKNHLLGRLFKSNAKKKPGSHLPHIDVHFSILYNNTASAN